MSAKLFKHIYDISVLYTIGAFLLSCIGGISLRSWSFPVLLIAIAASMLLERRKRIRTLVTILFPAALLPFLISSIPDLAIFLLAWAYFSYVSITGRIVNSRGEFIDLCKHTAVILLAITFLMLAVFQNMGKAFLEACPYFIAALVSAVFLLRYLRLGSQAEHLRGYHRQQWMELLAFLAISLLLTLINAPQNILNGLLLIYHNLVVPIITFLGSVLGLIVSGILQLLFALLRLISKNQDTPMDDYQFGKSLIPEIDATDTAVTDISWVMPFLYSIGAIIALLLLFFFLRRLMGGKLKQMIPAGISETREYLDDGRHKRSTFRSRRPRGPGAAVRYYYQKSLLWMQHKKVKLKPQDTTEEINEKYESLIGEDAVTQKVSAVHLKELYRKARYQTQEQITAEEAEKAKQLYQEVSRLHSKSKPKGVVSTQ